jgi:hypothetical protein
MQLRRKCRRQKRGPKPKIAKVERRGASVPVIRDAPRPTSAAIGAPLGAPPPPRSGRAKRSNPGRRRAAETNAAVCHREIWARRDQGGESKAASRLYPHSLASCGEASRRCSSGILQSEKTRHRIGTAGLSSLAEMFADFPHRGECPMNGPMHDLEFVRNYHIIDPAPLTPI